MKKMLSLFLLIVCTMYTAYSGVVVEGKVKGVAPISTLKYLTADNTFVLNDTDKLQNPVSSEELLELIDAINLDERIGVSVTLNDELIVYGKLHKRSETAGMLETADNFIRSVVFAEYSRLRKYNLPHNYKPIRVAARERSSVIFLQLSDFTYNNINNNYQPVSQKADIMLIPMATYTAPDGGYLPDYDALEKGIFQKEDKANADQMNLYKDEYLQLPPLGEALKVGRAAALIRFFRDNGINMSELKRSIIEADAITLVGKEAVADGEVADLAAAGSAEKSDVKVPAEFLTAANSNIEEISEDSEVNEIIPVNKFAVDSGVIAKVEPKLQNDYAESIRQVFLIDKIIGNTGKVKLSRKSINDGSYVRYRTEYLQGITDADNIDLENTPEDFQAAFRRHIAAWEHVISWLKGKNIADGQEAFAEFYDEHGKYREELKNTYNECRRIAAKYQYID